MKLKKLYNNLYSKADQKLGWWNKNVGPKDAKFRITLGVILIVLAPLQALGYVPIPLLASTGAAIAGIVILLEGLFSRCILYSILGIDRCPVDVEE